MTKVYDQAYFARWYGRPGTHSPAALARKVALAVAAAEYYLQRPIRSVLDVGCGEGRWRAPLLKLRPGLRYQGLDSSEYAVRRFGRARNIGLATFGQMAELRLGQPADLLVCADVLHYVPDAELARGLSGFGELCDGVAFIEVYTKDDAIAGDLRGFLPRRADWYRRRLTAAGWRACGSHLYLSPHLASHAAALEAMPAAGKR
jgi:SAM-dependent methyltransferase